MASNAGQNVNTIFLNSERASTVALEQSIATSTFFEYLLDKIKALFENKSERKTYCILQECIQTFLKYIILLL